MNVAKIMTMAERLRNKLGEDNNSPIDIMSLVQSIDNLTLVYYPMSDNMSGMCIKGENNNNVIAINSQMTLGRQRFSIAHELYHLYYDDSMVFVCSKQVGDGTEVEKKADIFATHFLMPAGALTAKVEMMTEKKGGKLSMEDVIRIEQYFGASHQATLYHLLNCDLISQENLDKWINISVRKKAQSIGYSDDLYRPSPENKQYYTYGNYIDLAEQLISSELISEGKYEEILLEAFRYDLVYGEEEDGDIID